MELPTALIPTHLDGQPINYWERGTTAFGRTVNVVMSGEARGMTINAVNTKPMANNTHPIAMPRTIVSIRQQAINLHLLRMCH